MEKTIDCACITSVHNARNILIDVLGLALLITESKFHCSIPVLSADKSCTFLLIACMSMIEIIHILKN